MGCLLVRVSGKHLAVPLEGVEQVVVIDHLLPVPAAVPAVRGVIRVRDRMVSLVHLGALVSETEAPDVVSAAAVVLSADGARVAFEVDEAADMLAAAPGRVPAGWRLPWAVGVVRHAGGLIPVVNVSTLMERLRGTRAVAGVGAGAELPDD